ACGIATILDDLDSLLVIQASLQTIIPKLLSVHRSKQISGVVSNGILNAEILPEVSRNRDHATVRILFLRLLRILTLAVPTGTAPTIPGQAALHSKDIVGILSKLTLSITGFQNELSQ